LSAPCPTDILLWRLRSDTPTDPALPARARALLAEWPTAMVLQRMAHHQAQGLTYLYARLPERALLDATGLLPLTQALSALQPGPCAVDVSRLELVLDVPGHSRGATPNSHYVVETDADEGWMPEIARWYDTEHMPGLAHVPGCIHARRLTNHDHGPVSFACYDLTDPGVKESPPWLAVRGTPWSDRTRPHFANTRRTMFEGVLA
jgi:hypothetical protein